MSEITPPYDTALSDAELADIRHRADSGSVQLERDIRALLAEIDRLRRENATLRVGSSTPSYAVVGSDGATVTHVAGHPVPDRRVVNAIIADLNARGHSGEDV